MDRGLLPLARHARLSEAGTLTLKEIKSASASQIVLTASGSNLPPSTLLTLSFTFTGNGAAKIDGVQITN